MLLDAAHNPHGVAALARFLSSLGRRFVLVFGALADKDFTHMLPPLAGRASALVLTRPDSPRALDPARLLALLPDRALARVEADPAAALGTALGLAAASGVDLVVVAGSIYLIAVCLLPDVLRVIWAVPFYFGGTSVLIVVVVIMDCHRANPGASDFSPVRQPDEEGEPEVVRSLRSRPEINASEWRRLLGIKSGRVAGTDVRERENESPGFSQDDLPELQDRAPQTRAVRDLHRKEAQAAAGLNGKTV